MLRFLFYAIFDNKVGPQLPVCVPYPFISLKDFNSIASFIIPRPSFSHRLISFKWNKHIILNYPIRIEDSKYERHAFFFSFGMVLDQNINEEIEAYEVILKRLTLIFLSLEKDFLYLSKHSKSDHYPRHFEYLNDDKMINCKTESSIESKDYLLRNVLFQIFDGFKKSGECSVNLMKSRKIALKLFNKLSSPQIIKFHNVPVLICNVTNFIDYRWDICLHYVLQQINSINHVQRICNILNDKLMGNVDSNAIKECIKQLLYKKYIAITDIFAFNNLYIVTQKINDLMTNQCMQQSFCSFIGKQNNKELIIKMYKMLTKFDGKQTVKELIQKYEWKQFDIHKFVLFGSVNKLIRRIHRFPIIIKQKDIISTKTKERIQKLKSLCDGSHCFDEICCELKMNQKQIKKLLIDNFDHVVLLK